MSGLAQGDHLTLDIQAADGTPAVVHVEVLEILAFGDAAIEASEEFVNIGRASDAVAISLEETFDLISLEDFADLVNAEDIREGYL